MSAPEPTDVALSVGALPTAVVAACRGAAAKQGRDTMVLAVGEVLSIAEHFVITGAPNDRQVKAIAEEVVRAVADAVGLKPLRSEGLDSLHWVLLDYGDLVIHVFDEEARRYYDLERLWGNAPRLAFEPASASAGAQSGG